ncbi:hypothetical protein EJ02DRAFT_243623 [Clathrospora elynae]|uniref:Chitin-binding type-1 domain-containing protein n=1 Tax=Clathrospora elynae TaxID=706981 RepID=A0A6A5SJT4_9PLEO|nr:hypothetical protein EJ02DRAFT_243623 [Clathrospora elynae]
MVSRIQPESYLSLKGIMAPVDGPLQCGPDQPCKDDSCCNSLENRGFIEIHCKGNGTVTYLSNCDAKAMCSKDSKDSKTTCGLNLCCSYYSWCGTEEIHCGDKDQEDYDTSCQKGYGKCEVVSPV